MERNTFDLLNDVGDGGKRKLKTNVLLLLLISLLLTGAGSAEAQKARKLPAGSYVSTAKIEILSGDSARYAYALAMLDSLFMNYGPHCEGLFWAGQIYVDYYQKASTNEGRLLWAKRMIAYRDTLKECCANDAVDRKFKKDCERNVAKSDSTLVQFWQERYNAGVEQLNQLIDIDSILKVELDSFVIADQKRTQAALRDSVRVNMRLAIMLDESDERPWIGLANAADLEGLTDSSNSYLASAIQAVDDSAKPALLLRVGYNYASSGKFCEAVPYLRDYMAGHQTDTLTAENLAICYSNCKMFDSAVAVYRRILAQAPENLAAHRGMASHFQDAGRALTDSVRIAEESKNETARKKFIDQRFIYFDSARHHSKLVFDRDSSDVNTAEAYALYSYLVDKNDEALRGYERASVLDASRVENWKAMGDIYFTNKKFEKAASAYEKALELESGNKGIMERLSFLYGELKQSAKQQAMNKRISAP